jgi:hypothetical protein
MSSYDASRGQALRLLGPPGSSCGGGLGPFVLIIKDALTARDQCPSCCFLDGDVFRLYRG